MKKIFALAAILASAVMMSCTSYRPVSAGEGRVGSKTGEATANFILGWIPLGQDNSMLEAAKNGGITKVATVDQKIVSYLVFAKVTTIVTGD